MRYLVLGAGAIGGYFGARLIQAGADVTFLVRPARAAALAREGLRVESPRGDVVTPAATVTADGLRGHFDLVLLSCKAYDLEDAIGSVAPAIAAGTGVLPLLNGVAHIERLGAAFGADRVLGGVAHIASTLRPDGVIHHLSGLAALRFGPIASGTDPWTPALFEALQRAGVDAVRSAAIMQDLWDKLVFLATLAGMTCLMRASVGIILSTDDGATLMQRLLDECSAVATAEGFAPDAVALARYRAMLMEHGSSLTASMLRDVERGAPTEAAHVLGDLVRRAESRGIDTPVLRIAHAHLQAYEATRNAAAGH